MVIEYARNILGFKNAQHEEYNPNSSELFITKLSCSLKGREMGFYLAPGSKGIYYTQNTNATIRSIPVEWRMFYDDFPHLIGYT